MARKRRQEPSGPQLAFPACVRLIAGPVAENKWQGALRIVPEWRVRPWTCAGRTSGLGPAAEVELTVSERLDVLVVPPPGTRDLRAGFWVGSVWVTVPSAWAACWPVAPELHDPAAGRFALDVHPTLRMEGSNYVV